MTLKCDFKEITHAMNDYNYRNYTLLFLNIKYIKGIVFEIF